MSFEVGGKCLAFHGPLLYEAKILKIWDSEQKKVETLNDGSVTATVEGSDTDEVPVELADEDCYFIHYQGWKSTWDEWIGSDRIKEFNEDNVQLRKKLVEDARNAKKLQQKRKSTASGASSGPNRKKHASASSSSSSSSSSGGGGGGGGSKDESSKRSTSPQQNSNSNLNSYNKQIIIPISKITVHIPVKLKSKLVDDWEFITKDKKIIKLPQTENNINLILQNFKKYFITKKTNQLNSLINQSLMDEFIVGMKLYFNKILPKILLYRLERLQYDEILKKHGNNNLDLCNFYGSIHLLRLISILPELISTTTMDEQSVSVIVKHADILLSWLSTVEFNNFFNFDKIDQDGDSYYINTSSQYEGVALGM
ncbi:hypothetical protein KAFR_0B02060 [Kazachstania africana CBS 2517]|uniref:Chromatin modification-related protein EAF3 n=1 Tax=Kazachstania africana (strain ATCC 22294 / BCRC 22015 / CBS 2517 / CECT 1963 / NBRC 1671 / NRRL Y-8276) TaxID=1071382 RepID=H2AQ54_KAZAF|nr:hypothetical protein KAFR_0B02060 [Kazachstania africana CBS 2517]CCF56504.1 hypothetical protein KAFR_0B02060 [Kazachstania africana CBS 2517]